MWKLCLLLCAAAHGVAKRTTTTFGSVGETASGHYGNKGYVELDASAEANLVVHEDTVDDLDTMSCTLTQNDKDLMRFDLYRVDLPTQDLAKKLSFKGDLDLIKKCNEVLGLLSKGCCPQGPKEGPKGPITESSQYHWVPRRGVYKCELPYWVARIASASYMKCVVSPETIRRKQEKEQEKEENEKKQKEAEERHKRDQEEKKQKEAKEKAERNAMAKFFTVFTPKDIIKHVGTMVQVGIIGLWTELEDDDKQADYQPDADKAEKALRRLGVWNGEAKIHLKAVLDGDIDHTNRRELSLLKYGMEKVEDLVSATRGLSVREDHSDPYLPPNAPEFYEAWQWLRTANEKWGEAM